MLMAAAVVSIYEQAKIPCEYGILRAAVVVVLRGHASVPLWPTCGRITVLGDVDYWLDFVE